MEKLQTKIRKQLLVQIVIPLLFSLLLLIVGYFITNPATKKLLVKERRQMVQEMVNSIHNLTEAYNQKVLQGEISLEEAQSIVINNIRNQHYGKNRTNYFWIQDYNGKLIFHPYLESKKPPSKQILKQMDSIAKRIGNVVKKQDECFITYTWFINNNYSTGSTKESFAQSFKPWNWIICSGFMLSDLDADLNQLTKDVLGSLFLLLGGMIIILTFVLLRNYRNLQRMLISDTELKKSEARFRGFVSHIDNGLLIFENEKPVFVNNQFCHIFEITKTDFVQFNLFDYLPGWEKERVNIIFKTSFQQQINEFTAWLRLKNGTEKFVNLRYIINIETDADYKYLVVQDLTEQKQSFTTIDVLSENLAQNNDSIVITDLNGTIEYVNPGFERVTGYTSKEAIGKTPQILKSGKMSQMVYENLWKTITSGEVWKGELLNKKKDGSLFWEATLIFPIKNKQNEIIKYSSIKTDITHTKQIEQELISSKNKAEESERYKTAFLNNVSHEVRTPLNAIYGFSQLLKENFATDETYSSYFNIIEQNAQILLRLFEDILDLSSIESKSVVLKKEDIRVKELVLRIVSKYNVHLTVNETKPVEIIVEEDPNFDTMVLHTDRKRFNQIFDKLLSNAVKFTLEGHIKINYTLLPDSITFHISDTGVGIPDEERELIFKSFSHGEHLYVSLHKGLGLGLNIAKILIELLGGKLSFISEKGIGTTFSLSFPTTDLKNYTLNGNVVASFKHMVNEKTILIAEDNDEIFKYLEAILAPQNTLLRATTGAEALTLLDNNHNPDIILMDILMPEMDGISATRIIRLNYESIPIIAMTAIAKDLTPLEREIFNQVLSKPVLAKELLKVMSEELGKSKL